MKWIVSFSTSTGGPNVQLVEAPRVAAVEHVILAEVPHAVLRDVIPIDLPPYGAWIEIREGGLYYVCSRRGMDSKFRRVRADDCVEAARLMGSECFGAMLVANALAGGASAGWALSKTGYSATVIAALIPKILAPACDLADQAASALDAFATDASAANRNAAERTLRAVQYALWDCCGEVARPSEWSAVQGSALADTAAWGCNAVNSMGNDDVRPAYRARHDPDLLRKLASEWRSWAASICTSNEN